MNTKDNKSERDINPNQITRFYDFELGTHKDNPSEKDAIKRRRIIFFMVHFTRTSGNWDWEIPNAS